MKAMATYNRRASPRLDYGLGIAAVGAVAFAGGFILAGFIGFLAASLAGFSASPNPKDKTAHAFLFLVSILGVIKNV